MNPFFSFCKNRTLRDRTFTPFSFLSNPFFLVFRLISVFPFDQAFLSFFFPPLTSRRLSLDITPFRSRCDNGICVQKHYFPCFLKIMVFKLHMQYLQYEVHFLNCANFIPTLPISCFRPHISPYSHFIYLRIWVYFCLVPILVVEIKVSTTRSPLSKCPEEVRISSAPAPDPRHHK